MESQTTLTMQPIGYVRNKIDKPFLKVDENGLKMKEQTDEAMAAYQKTVQDTSEIIIDEQWTELLEGIEEYSHLIVLYWAHKLPEKSRSLARVHPMGNDEYPLVGVFSTCSPARPNPILLTVVNLRDRKNNILEVGGLDAVDGSPIIDIKPFVDKFYAFPDIKIPEWMEAISRKVEEIKNKEAD